MSTLYELTDDYLRLLEFAEDVDVEEQAFIDTMEAIEGEIEDKADGYARVIKQLSADAEALDKEAKRLSDRKQSIDNRIKRMKESLTKAMVVTGKTKFKTDLFSFNVQKNAPATVIDDEEAIPEEFWRVKREVDKSKIKDALKEGKEFKWAHLEQGESVRIR